MLLGIEKLANIGAVYSRLRDAYHSTTILVAGIAESSADFKELLERFARPRLPVENSTKSFWQQRPPFPKLVDIKSDKLPASADIVIIGSGMSGASIAHTILQECRSLDITKRVVLVEGRTICSGATGRNGGHIKASSYAEYAKFKKRFGAKSAKKILAFYMKHLPLLTELARVEGYEKGEARQVLTVDAFTEQTMMRKATEMVELLRTDLPEIAKGIEIIGKEELQEVSCVVMDKVVKELTIVSDLDSVGCLKAESHLPAGLCGHIVLSPLSSILSSPSFQMNFRLKLKLWSS